ncbi:hypothetical protein GW17_00026540 [Ensete ventricosum]|nr:hypothetical protein GW17_00026540 [Ensete ventricosum]
MRGAAITALVLTVLVGLVVLVFWLFLPPKPLEYTIDDAHIRGFNITAHALNAVFDLRLRSYNRNTRASVYYDAMEVTVWYGEQMVAISRVAPFYQPRHYVQTITVSSTAQSTPLLGPVEKNLRRNESAGELELEVRARARIRFAVGAVKKHYKLKAYCAPVVVRCIPSSHFDRVYYVQREEKNVQKAIKDAAKRNDMASAKAGVMEEMVNDAVDTALDSEDIEEEIEEEVDKVLAAIAGETVSQLPDAVRKEKIKQPSVSTAVGEREAVAEGAEDEDLDEIRERLARVRS